MFTQTGIGSLEEKEIWKEGIWKAMVFFCLFNAFKIITFHTEHFRCFDAYILIVLYYDFELIVQWTENKVNTNRKKKKTKCAQSVYRKHDWMSKSDSCFSACFNIY